MAVKAIPGANLHTFPMGESMSDAVHGHEMLELVAGRPGGWGLEELRAEAEARWGRGAGFCNCHGDQFTFDSLIPFLALKGKLRLEKDRVCSAELPHRL